MIAPVGLVGQWAAEIKRMAPGYRTIEHHGQSRTTGASFTVTFRYINFLIHYRVDPEELKRAHVVVSSYATVTSEHGVYSSQSKDESEGVKKGKSKKVAASDSEEDELSDSESFGRARTSKRPVTKKKVKDALYHVHWFRIVLGNPSPLIHSSTYC